MAGKISAKGAVISVDDSGGSPQDISKDCVTYELEYAVDPVEVTGFTDGSKNATPGVRICGITLEVLWNSTATTGAMTVLKGIVGSTTSKTVSVTPESGATAYSGEFMCDGIHPKGSSSSGAITLGSVHFSVMGATAPTFS